MVGKASTQSRQQEESLQTQLVAFTKYLHATCCGDTKNSLEYHILNFLHLLWLNT